MELENRLQRLQEIKVGQVEKVIGDIEKIKGEKERIADEYSESIEIWKNSVQEKLPKIIENILLLRPLVLNLNIDYKNDEFAGDLRSNEMHFSNRGFGSSYIRVQKKPEIGFKFCACYLHNNPDYWSYWKDNSFYIKFKEDSSQNIVFSHNNVGSWLSSEKIKGKDSEDFTSKYIDFTIPIIGDYDSRFLILLPSILNKMPEEIKKAYGVSKKLSGQKLNHVKSSNSQNSSLDVSDF